MIEPCGCKIIFYGLMSDMGGEIKFCPLHAAAPAMQAKLQAAEEMAKAMKLAALRFHVHAGSFKEQNLLYDSRCAWQDMKDVEAALKLWEKAGRGEG